MTWSETFGSMCLFDSAASQYTEAAITISSEAMGMPRMLTLLHYRGTQQTSQVEVLIIPFMCSYLVQHMQGLTTCLAFGMADTA